LVSKYLPAWFLGAFPEKRVMLAGYGAAFARDWGRKARELLREFGPELFGVHVQRDRRAADDWGLEGHSGGMVTAGVGGPLTGRGADLLIIDDPVKNSMHAYSEHIREVHWDWWQSTASTRIEPGGCAVVIATRWHIDDLSGRLLGEADAGGAVRRLRLPAIAEECDPLGRSVGEPLWPERWPLARLDEKRRRLESAWWLSLFQQLPGHDPRATWPADYFGTHIWARRWPESFEDSVLAIDPSLGRSHGDYSAVVFAGASGGLRWIDASIRRRPPEQIVADAIRLTRALSPRIVVIESNHFQDMLGAEFARQCLAQGCLPPHLVPMHNTDAKDLRISRLGYYLYPRLLRFRDTPDVHQLVEQLREYHQRTHDDGPDALEMALRKLEDERRCAGIFDVDVELAQAR
jgi:predicted phage terminase large subunit-like protein